MSVSSYAVSRIDYKSVLLDIISFTFIYFIPALSHLFSLPIYYAEPMRIMVILAIAHTRKNNAYILALTLPIFSFLVSAHPSILKTLLITVELLLNVWFFYTIRKQFKNEFVAMLFSILLSKTIYYLLKFSMISLLFIESSLFSTPIWIQVITTFIFSFYIFLAHFKTEHR